MSPIFEGFHPKDIALILVGVFPLLPGRSGKEREALGNGGDVFSSIADCASEEKALAEDIACPLGD